MRDKDVYAAVDGIYVNKVSYLINTSQHIRFVTAEMIKNVKCETPCMQERRIQMTDVLADNQFTCT